MTGRAWEARIEIEPRGVHLCLAAGWWRKYFWNILRFKDREVDDWEEYEQRRVTFGARACRSLVQLWFYKSHWLWRCPPPSRVHIQRVSEPTVPESFEVLDVDGERLRATATACWVQTWRAGGWWPWARRVRVVWSTRLTFEVWDDARGWYANTPIAHYYRSRHQTSLRDGVSAYCKQRGLTFIGPAAREKA